MVKTLIKIPIFIATFVATIIIAGKIMNRDNENRTMAMNVPMLPVITVLNEDTYYNEMHGYSKAMDPGSIRGPITVLGEKRQLSFLLGPSGHIPQTLSFEVRSIDGARLIENTEIKNFEITDHGVEATIQLKDLIDKDTEYQLILIYTDYQGKEARYYTRIIWSDRMALTQKLQFVQEFHEKTFDKEAAKDLIRYLESNKTADNTNFHKVDIHSSFAQVTWGDLVIQNRMNESIEVLDLTRQTADIRLTYMLSIGEEHYDYYKVVENYRIRYTTERVYLLDYERTMTQIPDMEGDIYANDKIVMGIMDEDLPMLESSDGNRLVFESVGRIYSYNASTNKLANLFSFYDKENMDSRSLYDNYGVKILHLTEEGNVYFALYGYMNRGRREGDVCIRIMCYNSAQNVVEEVLYIPYSRSVELLKCELNQLMYLNEQGKLYLYLDHTLYEISVADRTFTEITEIADEESIEISDNQKIVVWHEQGRLVMWNLETGEHTKVTEAEGETLRPLNFMNEDIIYGVIRDEDVVIDRSGHVFAPMYKVCIVNIKGQHLKEYQEDNVYITDSMVKENEITLDRVSRKDNGSYVEISQEHILNNQMPPQGHNKVSVVAIDVYQKIVQLQLKNKLDVKTLQMLTPLEVLPEENPALTLPGDTDKNQYYAYAMGEVLEASFIPGSSVAVAYERSGVVVDKNGNLIWRKGNRSTRNQIMAIGEVKVTEGQSSLAACLDTMLSYEGISRNSQEMLGQGNTAQEILRNGLGSMQVLDLGGCPLDAVLYYVNQDIPVLATLENGEAVLIVGFNEFNTVILEPETGKLYKKGMNDSAEWFEQNGNHFISYYKG